VIDADPALLEANLSAIRGRNPRLARRLAASESDQSVRAERARDGSVVPFVASGRKSIFLHSRFDPAKEAERLASGSPEDGYYLCPGLGGAFHVRALLKRRGTSGVLVIEPSPSFLRATLERVDMRDVLSSDLVEILSGADAEECAEILSGAYLPALSGGLRSLPLRARADLDPALFREAMDSVQAAIARVSSDFTAQAVFGKRWFSNAVRNLVRASHPLAELPRADTVLVAAAGPSLERQVSAIAAARAEGGFLVSTDTALPFLLASSLKPDAVLSIDCQHISYRHFVPGYPAGTPLLVEISSPSALTRISSEMIFYTTANPLGRLLSGRLRELPSLDASGGNVTHAALSLADRMGAREVRLFGADYSYPSGKSYARGTHLYAEFSREASRLAPLESRMADILYRSPSLARARTESGFIYRNPGLDSEKTAAEAFSSRMGPILRPEPGEGQAIRVAERAEGSEGRVPASGGFSAGEPRKGALEALADLRSDIEALAVPEDPLAPSIRRLPRQQAELWLALLPVAAAVTRDSGATRPREALALARRWAIDSLASYLQARPAAKP